MKKIFITFSVVFNGLFLAYFLCVGNQYKVQSEREALCLQKDTSDSALSNLKNSKRLKKHNIAILTPATHPALRKIEKGFIKTLLKDSNLKCTFKVYNANGKLTLMRSQLEEILYKKYDMLCTIGAHATLMAKEVTVKKKSDIPIVFAAVAYPASLNLIESEQSSGNNLTGSSASTNYPDQINILLMLKPGIKNVLIVYDPTQSSGLEKDKREIVELLKKKQIGVNVVEVYKGSDIYQKVSGLLSNNVDVLITLKDNTVVPAIDSLVKLCSRYGVTLLTTNLDAIEKGAALAYGVYESSFGSVAAGRASIILKEGKHPSQVPIAITDNYKMLLNLKTMQKQGLKVDDKLLLLMKSIRVV